MGVYKYFRMHTRFNFHFYECLNTRLFRPVKFGTGDGGAGGGELFYQSSIHRINIINYRYNANIDIYIKFLLPNWRLLDKGRERERERLCKWSVPEKRVGTGVERG